MISRRRRCLLVAAAAGLVAPLPSGAQTAGKVYRIGFLSSGAESASDVLKAALREGLRDFGWIEGRNIAIDWRFAEGRNERLPELAAALVRDNVDIIVVQPTAATLAAKRATSTIPIVMAAVIDPVGLGIVASLAHPGGNVTGLTYGVDLDIFGKQLELLKEAVPAARRIAVLHNANNPGHAAGMGRLGAAARKLGIVPQFVASRGPDDFDAAFASIAKGRADALFVMSDPMFGAHAARLAELSTRYRLPTMHGARGLVDAGGLFLYGPNIASMIRQTASYVDRILKGAAPGTLPVEHPTRFLLVVNLKTARALGLTIPPGVLLRADEVIE